MQPAENTNISLHIVETLAEDQSASEENPHSRLGDTDRSRISLYAGLHEKHPQTLDSNHPKWLPEVVSRLFRLGRLILNTRYDVWMFK